MANASLRIRYSRIARPGFGVPNRRKRVFVLASMHGDARDVLLAQVRRGTSPNSSYLLVSSTMTYQKLLPRSFSPQGRQRCLGSCVKTQADGTQGRPCYECYVPPVKRLAGASDIGSNDLENISLEDCSLALDLGNAR